MARWLIIGPIVVVAFDTLASIAARTVGFDYGSLWPLSVLLAVTMLLAVTILRAQVVVPTATPTQELLLARFLSASGST